MMEKKPNKTRILVECGVLLAAALALSLTAKIKFLPYGGSITIGAMIPVILIAYRHGTRWGLLSGFAFSLVRMLIGIFSGLASLSLAATILMILLDYIVAYTVLGFAGMFKGKFKHPGNEFALGALVVTIFRYLCHVLSGYLFFSEYAKEFFVDAGSFGQTILTKFSGTVLSIVYSMIYNATYMIPEILITVVLCYLLSSVPGLISKKEKRNV